MAKRKPDEPAPFPTWMNTFSDLMNLLLCFFVMLFAMSTIDEEKYAQLVASLQSTISFFDAGSKAVGDGVLISNGVSQLNELDEYINSTGKTAESEQDSENFNENEQESQEQKDEMQEKLESIEAQHLKENEELAENISEAVNESRMTDQIEVSVTSQYVQLSLRGALLFDSGQAQVKESAIPVLSRVGMILQRYASGTIEIEGHTDNVPISNARFANNDELSSARALSVFYYFSENTTLDPKNIKHSGRGEWNPIADNSTEAGRARNRRVEIRIYNPAQ